MVASASQDSSATINEVRSEEGEVKSEERRVKNSCEEWTEMVWVATPLPDGGVTVTGKTYSYHTSTQEAKSEEGIVKNSSEAKSEERSVKNTSVSESSKTNDVKTTSKQSSDTVWTILSIWLLGVIAIVGLGYWLAKRNNK